METNRIILIVLIVLIIIIIIINNNNTTENLDVSKNIINLPFTIKSNEAIQNLASMYNSNKLYAASADIGNINANKLCLKNNMCIDDKMINRFNSVVANELIYYKDQMIILDDMNKYIHIYSKHNKLDTMSSKPGNTIYIPLGYI